MKPFVPSRRSTDPRWTSIEVVIVRSSNPSPLESFRLDRVRDGVTIARESRDLV